MSKTTRKELAEVIGSKTLHVQDRDKLVAMVAGYFASTDHAGSNIDMSSLMRDVMQYRQSHGIVEATIVSAHDVDKSIEKEARDILTEYFPDAETVIINKRIDADVLGGVRIDLPMKSLDMSVRSKLNTFKQLIAKENK